MVSSSKAKRQAKRAEAMSSKASSKVSSAAVSVNGDSENETDAVATDVAKMKLQEDEHGLSDRVTTGVLSSLVTSRDIKVTSVSLTFHGKVLIQDSTLELNYGRRYGLLGENGCGKSTFLRAIAAREYPIPEQIDIYLLNEPAEATSYSALEYVVREAENELKRLEQMAEDVLEKDGPESSILEELYERIESMDPSTFEARASLILRGLGFNNTTIKKMTKDMSGGWRMRVALAKALFVKPSLLLLDDPTAHLDLEACVWLEEYLKRFDRILVLVSHSQDFLNGVCSNMIDMRLKKLNLYGGNYDSYVKTRSELETNQMKAYNKQQEEIAHIKKFIASAGTYANLVRQAKSRQKILDKMEADGFIEKVVPDKVFSFRFTDVEKLPPPVLSFDDVTFSYSGKSEDNLYEHLDFGVDMDSRIALVGPNGVGKSTLLKIMTGELQPVGGRVSRHSHLKLGVYSQHSADQLDLRKSALEFVRDKYPKISQDYQFWRQQLGRYGLTGEGQTATMATLSEGQRSRVVFALLAIETPNVILLDEPTNGLDIPTIDSLAEAIDAFEGGVVVVSHDFRLLDKIAKDIYVCNNKTTTRWEGSILQYKSSLAKNIVI
ncbi:P-loop containing nucleoside triphosphate hydrolase protein [Lipomyces tetrasporus]|uniref:P-loop containing nucleoside triphosphate hydrolase protein n=1 Tax=Lipomyces tetrasporus TaxID=54092 RepID=A0AAD7QLR2_9ASCO|nr:P-loop containing nucleoside triphosphate hydrolase protein [Lipomyces tetrasporus]KAJ8097260.1 P-loop containing nucleoside triphosphate hydrolase protein [Lipomyces tetrasporus]